MRYALASYLDAFRGLRVLVVGIVRIRGGCHAHAATFPLLNGHATS
jgi:hypothetical protein